MIKEHHLCVGQMARMLKAWSMKSSRSEGLPARRQSPEGPLGFWYFCNSYHERFRRHQDMMMTISCRMLTCWFLLEMHTCPNGKMYLSNFWNVFVQIAKYIWKIAKAPKEIMMISGRTLIGWLPHKKQNAHLQSFDLFKVSPVYPPDDHHGIKPK